MQAIVKIGNTGITEEVVEFVLPPKSLDEVKGEKLNAVKLKFKELIQRPRVNTGLGFDVDGSYQDLENFKSGRDLGILQVKDADNVKHDITITDYDQIINAIQSKGFELYNWKWLKEEEINNCLTVEAVELVEV